MQRNVLNGDYMNVSLVQGFELWALQSSGGGGVFTRSRRMEQSNLKHSPHRCTHSTLKAVGMFSVICEHLCLSFSHSIIVSLCLGVGTLSIVTDPADWGAAAGISATLWFALPWGITSRLHHYAGRMGEWLSRVVNCCLVPSASFNQLILNHITSLFSSIMPVAIIT